MGKDAGRPLSITVIASVNLLGALLTLGFWGLILVRVFASETPPPGLDEGSVSTIFGFMVGDLTWALVLLAASVPGLLRMRVWGWLTGQMVNILWLYSMTVIWCRDLHAGSMSPGGLIFAPFVPFSVWALVLLWRRRLIFGIGRA